MTAAGTLKRALALGGVGTVLVAPKHRRRAKLTEQLGALHGLPEKLSQLLALGQLTHGEAHLETLTQGHDALTPKAARRALEAELGALETHFSTVSMNGIGASLGQVHRATLHDGREVAVKLQYPGIAEAVQVDLKAMGWLGQAAKRGYDLGAYRQTLQLMVERELDYRLEAQTQTRFRALVATEPQVVVPEVVAELSGARVLTMTWLEGSTLEVLRAAPLHVRQEASRALIRFFLRSLLEWRLLHGDLHPGNLRFQVAGDGAVRLGVLDFGCAQSLDDALAGGLRVVCEAAARLDEATPQRWLARFEAMGFSGPLLSPIAPKLQALTRLLLAPLTTDATFDPTAWDLSERMNALLGEARMAFRVAAPSSFAFVTRAFLGLTQVLRVLAAPVAWRPLFDEVSARTPLQADRALEVRAPPRAPLEPECVCRSSALRVTVRRPPELVLQLSFPARAAAHVGGLIPPEVLPRLAAHGVDLDALEARARSTEFEPQQLFHLNEPGREVRVWLE